MLEIWFEPSELTEFKIPDFINKWTYAVCIKCSDLFVDLHYTTDGSEPTLDSPMYLHPLILGGELLGNESLMVCINVRAFKHGNPVSNTVKRVFVFNRLPKPSFKIKDGHIFLTNKYPGKIYYVTEDMDILEDTGKPTCYAKKYCDGKGILLSDLNILKAVFIRTDGLYSKVLEYDAHKFK